MGDNGKTLGCDMLLVDKFSPEIKLLGKLDELNCMIGYAICHLNLLDYKKKHVLEEIQHQLFDIGSFFFNKKFENCEIILNWIEKHIEIFNKNLLELNSFLLPNGSKSIVTLHIARTKSRETERIFWEVWNNMKFNSEKNKNDSKLIGIYLNRLSDLLFIFIRKKSKKKWISNKLSKNL